MQTLGVLRVVVVCGSEQLDRPAVVVEEVELGKLEVFPDPEVDEHALVRVEPRQSIVEKRKGARSMGGIRREIKEIEQRAR